MVAAGSLRAAFSLILLAVEIPTPTAAGASVPSYTPLLHICGSSLYDPSAPILRSDGTWHLFEDAGGWSHYHSKDLLHWTKSTTTTHFSGMTGSIAVTEKGTFAIWPDGGQKIFNRSQALDVGLTKWGPKSTVLSLPPGVSKMQVRNGRGFLFFIFFLKIKRAVSICKDRLGTKRKGAFEKTKRGSRFFAGPGAGPEARRWALLPPWGVRRLCEFHRPVPLPRHRQHTVGVHTRVWNKRALLQGEGNARCNRCKRGVDRSKLAARPPRRGLPRSVPLGGGWTVRYAAHIRRAASGDSRQPVAYAGAGVRKRRFLSTFSIKMIVLPRQARDKHRETSKKSGRPVFSQWWIGDIDMDTFQFKPTSTGVSAGTKNSLFCSVEKSILAFVPSLSW
eukprot:COSAG06_NODE_3695_length_4999_cov_8.221837_5_plen_391_part_00